MSRFRIRNKHTRKVNSGWHLYISKEYGEIWSGSSYLKDGEGVFVRRILFSVRAPYRRFIYGHPERRTNRLIRCGRYFEYMKREWNDTRLVVGIKRNTGFKRFVRDRYK